MSEKKRPCKTRKQYTFEEDTAIVAQTIINILGTSIVDPHPFIAALLEGYAQRIRTLLCQRHLMYQSASESLGEIFTI